MRSRVAYLGVKLLNCHLIDEYGHINCDGAELLFLNGSGEEEIVKLPVLAHSKKYIITPESVLKIDTGYKYGEEQDENYLTFQEFLDQIEN